MSEDGYKWTNQHMLALRNGISAMTTKTLGGDDLEQFPYEIIKALGLEPQDDGVDVLATISSLRAKAAHLDTALAALELADTGLDLMLSLFPEPPDDDGSGKIGFSDNVRTAYYKAQAALAAVRAAREGGKQ